MAGEATMRSLLIVVAQPSGQVGGAAVGAAVRQGVGPLTQERLDEALGLAVGLGRVGPGGDVARGQEPTHLAKEARDVARAVVGHHALDPDALALEPAQRADQEAGDRLALLIRQDLDVRQARGVIDRDMDELPAGTLRAVAAIAGDPVADAAEAGGVLGIEVDKLAGACAAVTPRRLARLEGGQAAEPQPPEMAGDGAPRQGEAPGGLPPRRAGAGAAR